MFKNVAVKSEDKLRIKELSKRLNLKEYEVITKLLDAYERLEILQHYLGCESIEHLFHEIEEMLPKSRKQLLIAKTNRYLEELEKLGIPVELRDKISMAVFKILDGGRF